MLRAIEPLGSAISSSPNSYLLGTESSSKLELSFSTPSRNFYTAERQAEVGCSLPQLPPTSTISSTPPPVSSSISYSSSEETEDE